MSQKYSITPEGAKSAATEIVKGMNHGVPADENVDLSVTDHSWMKVVAAIILRHAEQSPAISKKDLLRLRAIANEISDEGHNGWGNEIRQIVFRQLEATEAAQMREALRQEALKHAVMCMDRSCKRCNELQRELGPAGREEKP